MRFPRSRRARIVAAIVAPLVLVFCVMTAVLFVYPDVNAPERSDAIVVLGGHGAPAFDKGEQLAREGYAPALVFSLQTSMDCHRYRSYLAPRLPRLKVMCFTPIPQSTQGEARSIARLARQLGWTRIIVVLPTTQATRARLRIGRCYPGQVLEVAFSPEGVGEWLYQFAYEWGALFKALVLQPTC
jgi:uncharacterized SAM-binding protein YcdF (DUF218 family)